VIRSLQWQLPHDGVNIEQIGPGVVRFGAGQSYAEQIASQRVATEAEVSAARAALTPERFWALVDDTRRTSFGSCFVMAALLKRKLQALSPTEILGFELQFRDRMLESYRWDLWGVAYLVNGGASDDGLEYFRAWLIGQSREYLLAGLKNAERAADRAGRLRDSECEQILYCAHEAYEARAKQPMPKVIREWPAQPAGTKWKEEDLPRLYPKLVNKWF
jgi:hypothetical protein